MSPITNLTELWHDHEKDDALLLAAMPTAGTDYERFFRLCNAFSMMPLHPIRERAEEQLRVLFGCELPPISENCDAIWRLTAESILLHPFTGKDAGCVQTVVRSTVSPTLPKTRDFLSDYPTLPRISAQTYAEWENEQTKRLAEHLPDGGISFALAKDFHVQKANLYSADRHLSGEAVNPDLWATQMFRFLAHVLQKSDKKILLQTACDPSEIVKLFALTASERGLPPVLWMPERLGDAERLIDLCRAYPNPDVSLAVRAGDPVDPRDLATVVPIGRVRVFCE